MRPRFVLAIAFVLALAACSTGSSASSAVGPTVTGAWARAAASGGGSAAYFTLSNPTAADDALLSVSTPAAAMTQVHETVVDGNGTAAMKPVDRVNLPAGDTVEFKPGSYHVMLMGLSKDLTAGATIDLHLVFEHAGTVVVKADIRQG
jgi:periplasmic copper chaperone A